ncbi:unnamed protein product [Brachionus calyciflorus]|uniref:Nascent polypeptide-associated complex subunit alpha-like UBA domain-containing protein n=1 Tax=Brachionus calyciflorus TaxID=104777 RepID=A0A813M759_9BILA|nr:unnamed protein product [Brachionus calyciflorus]
MDEDKDTQAQAQQGKHNTGAADLEKVTDYAEEKEISGGNLDNAINAITDKRRRDAEQKADLEKRLASVKVKKEDVDVVVQEFEVPRPKAERVLKENNGDLQAALTALLNA